MNRLFYIASYPRSGNTFVRALLANYASGLPEPVNVNQLGRYSSGEHEEALWRELTGVPIEARSVEQQWRARPAYFERLRGDFAGRRLVKTHTANAEVFDTPAFDIRETDRAVYVVRHPCDVAISRADFNGWPLEYAVDELLLSGAYAKDRSDRGMEVMGSWAENVLSWQGEGRCPVLTIRYGDLCRNPVFELGRIATFLGMGRNPERLSAAVIFSRFEELQAQEQAGGFAEGPPAATSRRFFRVGRSRQWPEVMPPALVRRIYDACGPMIEQLALDEAALVEAPRPVSAAG